MLEAKCSNKLQILWKVSDSQGKSVTGSQPLLSKNSRHWWRQSERIGHISWIWAHKNHNRIEKLGRLQVWAPTRFLGTWSPRLPEFVIAHTMCRQAKHVQTHFQWKKTNVERFPVAKWLPATKRNVHILRSSWNSTLEASFSMTLPKFTLRLAEAEADWRPATATESLLPWLLEEWTRERESTGEFSEVLERYLAGPSCLPPSYFFQVVPGKGTSEV